MKTPDSQTTLKYVLTTLQADNKGKGGISSLYASEDSPAGGWYLLLLLEVHS